MILRRKLNTVTIGTAYELAVMQSLTNQLKMNLMRVGGANDRGVDLQGCTQTHPRISLLVQCKCENKKLSPRHIRELQGTLIQHGNIDTTMALLASPEGFTSKTVASAIASTLPLSLLHISTNGILHNCIFNHPASSLLNEAGLHLVKKFVRNGTDINISLEQSI